MNSVISVFLVKPSRRGHFFQSLSHVRAQTTSGKMPTQTERTERCTSPAEVDVVHEQPVTSLQSLDQHTIQPLKATVGPSILQLSQTLLQQRKVHLQFGHVWRTNKSTLQHILILTRQINKNKTELYYQ